MIEEFGSTVPASGNVLNHECWFHIGFGACSMEIGMDGWAVNNPFHKVSQLSIGFTKGIGSNVWVFKVQNGEYGGADEPQKSQNFVRPSK
jgi:hypothetical protein